MLIYPQINPIACKIGPIAIHWYGLMYLIGFVGGWLLANWRAKHSQGKWTTAQVTDLVFYCAIGVILGGRLGYVLFYNIGYFLSHPLDIFKTWQGGMSFHGGFLGVAIAFWVVSRRTNKSIWEVADFIAPMVPIGLAAGRIGNFINQELWGRVTDVPWGMIFPLAGLEPRHPSQLYEFLMEGVFLFIVLWWFSARPRPRMAVSALFLCGYGLARIITECFREPDPQYGFIFEWLTMGQILSIPMLLAGLFILYKIYIIDRSATSPKLKLNT